MDRNAIQRTHHTHHTLTGKLVVRNKCIILGNATVGKSAIVQQFHAQQAKFPKNYSMVKKIEVNIKIIQRLSVTRSSPFFT